MSAIGPGDFVVCVNVGRLRSPSSGRFMAASPMIRLGAVYLVKGYSRDGLGLQFAGFDYPIIVGRRRHSGHNPARFRPYQGPEQASRLTCEPVTERVTA